MQVHGTRTFTWRFRWGGSRVLTGSLRGRQAAQRAARPGERPARRASCAKLLHSCHIPHNLRPAQETNFDVNEAVAKLIDSEWRAAAAIRRRGAAGS